MNTVTINRGHFNATFDLDLFPAPWKVVSLGNDEIELCIKSATYDLVSCEHGHLTAFTYKITFLEELVEDVNREAASRLSIEGKRLGATFRVQEDVRTDNVRDCVAGPSTEILAMARSLVAKLGDMTPEHWGTLMETELDHIRVTLRVEPVDERFGRPGVLSQALLEMASYYGYHWHTDRQYYKPFVDTLISMFQGEAVMPWGNTLDQFKKNGGKLERR